MPVLLTLTSLRELGPWRYSVVAPVDCRYVGVVVAILRRVALGRRRARFWGAAGLGLIVAGRRYASGIAVLAGVFLMLATAAVLGGGFCCLSVGDGSPSIPITFDVRDVRTGLPFPARRSESAILLRTTGGAGPPGSEIPAGEAGAEGKTDQAGKSRAPYRFIASTRATYFTFRARVFVNGCLYLTVAAPRYASVTAPLHDYTSSYVDNKLDGSDLRTSKSRWSLVRGR